MTDEHRLEARAAFFTLLCGVLTILDHAQLHRQRWRYELGKTTGSDGRLDGGYEIHVWIDPPGVSPSSESRPTAP